MPTQTLQAYLESLPAWSNDDKMSSLFASFPAERSEWNAAGYDEKLRFWRQTLTDACSRGLLGDDLLCITVDALDAKFRRKGVTPLGLGVVLADMERTGDLISLDEFGKETGWSWWLFSIFVTKPLFWGYGQIAGVSPPKALRGKYVVPPLVQAISAKLLAAIRGDAHFATDYVLSLDALHTRFRAVAAASEPSAIPSNIDIDVTIQYLKRRLELAVQDLGDGASVAKIKNPKQSLTERLAITETDLGVVVIKSTLERLHTQVDQLESNSSDLTKQALERVRLGQKQRALHLIRQRKLTTEVLKKRLASVETIEAVMTKIQSAETDVEIMAAYNIGAETLKTVLKTSGLTVEAVETTMDKLQDALADQSEIDDALIAGQNAILSSDAIDDEELEQELDALLALEVDSLPSVPKMPLPEIAPTIDNPTELSQTPHATSGTELQETHDDALDAELDELDAYLGSLTISKDQGPVVRSDVGVEKAVEREKKEKREAVLAS